jgi:hypothetical protein
MWRFTCANAVDLDPVRNRTVHGMQALSVSALEYGWPYREGLAQVLGFATWMSRPAIQAVICQEGEPCGVACCCW